MDIDIDIRTLSKEEFKKYKLIDVREQEEIDLQPTIVTYTHVPLSSFPANKDSFKKNEFYLIFCAKGGRSHYMAEALAHEGIHALSVNYGINYLNDYLAQQ